MEKYDVIIIGAGPAGISASIYLKRANLKVLVIHNNKSALNKAVIENYYGIEKINGKELYELGIKQAKNLGVEVILDDVLEINDFIVTTSLNTYKSDYIILATGITRSTPKIENLTKYIGSGVSYCATCDGFFYRNKFIAVLGNTDFTLKEASYLKNLSKNVTILTNGSTKLDNITDFKIINKKIKEVTGSEVIKSIIFEDNSKLDIDGLFLALNYGSTEITSQLGILTEKNKVITNEYFETNINNIYAIGDITKGMMQVCKAVYDGALVAENIIKKRKTIIKNIN